MLKIHTCFFEWAFLLFLQKQNDEKTNKYYWLLIILVCNVRIQVGHVWSEHDGFQFKWYDNTITS